MTKKEIKDSIKKITNEKILKKQHTTKMDLLFNKNLKLMEQEYDLEAVLFTLKKTYESISFYCHRNGIISQKNRILYMFEVLRSEIKLGLDYLENKNYNPEFKCEEINEVKYIKKDSINIQDMLDKF
jgi:hypothetical protein